MVDQRRRPDGAGALAVALALAIAGTQALAGSDCRLRPFDLPATLVSAPLVLFGGLMFGYGMVAANACASRALVLLGRGNLRSSWSSRCGDRGDDFEGMLAPMRIAFLHWSETSVKADSVPALVAASGVNELAGAYRRRGGESAAFAGFAFAYAPFRQARGQIAAGVAIGLLIPAGWFATGYLGADASSRRRWLDNIRRAGRRYAAICDVLDRIDGEFQHRASSPACCWAALSRRWRRGAFVGRL